MSHCGVFSRSRGDLNDPITQFCVHLLILGFLNISAGLLLSFCDFLVPVQTNQILNRLCYTPAVTGGSIIFLYYMISVNLQHFSFLLSFLYRIPSLHFCVQSHQSQTLCRLVVLWMHTCYGFVKFIEILWGKKYLNCLQFLPGLSLLTFCYSVEEKTAFYLCHVCGENCPSSSIVTHVYSGNHYSNYLVSVEHYFYSYINLIAHAIDNFFTFCVLELHRTRFP